MRMRTPGVFERARWLVPAAALSMLGCPNQELAPLGPCTVSAVREEVSQSGISKVDLLFVIDNSRSMAEEQANLAKQLPRLVDVLTTGKREGKPDFVPVKSLQLAVITTDLAVTPGEVAGISQCAEGNTNDAVFQSSTKIAVEGQMYQDVTVPPLDGCDGVDPLHYQLFETEGGGTSREDVAAAFRCSAYVGVAGCAYEQQLEAMHKSLASSDDTSFVGMSKRGQGNPNGKNKNFVRDDAILAIFHVTDEEDCSVTNAGRVLFDPPTGSEWKMIGQNVRCGVAYSDPETSKELLQPISRYVDGLKKLKPENPDRIIFAGIIGIPEEAEGKSIKEILDHPDMQWEILKDPDGDFTLDEPARSCVTSRNGKAEWAYAPRRIVEAAGGFGENAALFSICREDYTPAVDSIIDRIASKLSGACLPRELTRKPDGEVACEVFEILEPGKNKCNPDKHDTKAPPEERTLNKQKRTACKMKQVAVVGNELPDGQEGWFYDNFTKETIEECTTAGEKQRINFTARGQLDPGSGATFECFQSVAALGGAQAQGFDAVNTNCEDDEGICAQKSNKDKGGYNLICVEELNSCQVDCKADPDCPPGWVCAKTNGGSEGPLYCQQPTCPQVE
jgi:hypothetical protein